MIRLAELRDLESLCNLLEILFGIEADFTADREKQARGLRLLMQQENAAILVAEKDHNVVGMATVQLVISTAEGNPSLLVEDVVVAYGYRGQGLGTKLLEYICKWGTQKGATRMQLLADLDNTEALDFYRATGWNKTQLVAFRKIVQ